MFQDTGPTPTIINLASNLNVSGVGGATNPPAACASCRGRLP